jgi:cobalt/nickel transport system permease protein
MTLALDVPPCPDSPLQRLDARWRLAALLLAAAAVAALRSPITAAVAFGGSLALVALARLPRRWFLPRLLGSFAFLVLFTAVLPFAVDDGGPALEVGPVRATGAGTRLAMTICLKALTILNLMLVLLATAPLPTTLKAAHALRLPGLLVQLAVLTYRYTFLLGAELARTRVALRVRGYRARFTRHNYRTVGRVAGSLLVRGHERAERVAQAMACRGFDGRFRALAEFHTSAADVTAFLAIVGGAAAALAGDVYLA